MRICFVSTEVAGVRGGGIGTYVVEAAHALTAYGHEVWLLTKVVEDNRSAAALRQLDCFHEVVQITRKSEPMLFHASAPYGHSVAVHEALLRCPRFDYVEFADYHAEGLVPIRAQRQLGSYGDTVLSVMLHLPSFECYELNGQLHRAGEFQREMFALEDEAIREAPQLVAPSRSVRDRVCRRLGITESDVTIVPYPMRLPEARQQHVRASLAELSFLYYGRIEPRKGLDALLEAFRSLPEVRLRVIGADTPTSPFGESYREWLSRTCPSNVSFESPLTREALAAEIERADVCVLPSRFDNYPNTCIEAMSLGRVVVGSQHGGMAEMIEHGVSGFLVDSHDPASIARVIRDELGSRVATLPSVGEEGARRIRKLASPDRYVDRVNELIAARRHRDATARANTPRQQAASEPTVSFVVPFHRDAATIDEAIDSILRQDMDEWEAVIVNDGSPLPEAAELLERQCAKDARVRIVHQENGGLSSARNLGIREARGRYLLMLDADNVLDERYARLGVETLKRRPDMAFVIPHVRFVDHESGEEIGIYNPLPYTRELALLMNRFGDAGAMFRRSAFTEHDLRYDELLVSFEDWALWIDLDRVGAKGCVIPVPLYDYRVRRDSMVHRDGWRNLSDTLGLLIERHFPVADSRQRDLLWSLQQTWGDMAYGKTADELRRMREDHAGTIRHRDSLREHVEELKARNRDLEARLQHQQDLLREAHADHTGTMRHRDRLQAYSDELTERAARQAAQLRRGLLARLKRLLTGKNGT